MRRSAAGWTAFSIVFASTATAAWLLGATGSVAANAPKFVDVTEKAGLSAFRNVQGDASAKPHILEVMGGGAAFLDYNNDGSIDTTTDNPQFTNRKNLYTSLSAAFAKGWDV